MTPILVTMEDPMTGYTPGPWQLCEDDENGRHRVAAGKKPFYTIATVDRYAGPNWEGRSNARLITAAPDLLEGAQAITVLRTNDDGSITIGPRGWAMMRAAIAKATGEERPHDVQHG